MKLLVDTSAYVGFKLGIAGLVEYLSRARAVCISPVVLGELLFGFRNGSRFDQNMQELELFLDQGVVQILQLTDITSDRYSRIAHQLKSKGTPIPSNDIWIAAQTMESGAELITMDAHFENIDGLVVRFFSRP